MKRSLLALFLSLLFLYNGSYTESHSTEIADPDIAEEVFLLVNAEEPTVPVLGLARNEHELCYPASTTKILTCLVALESASPELIIEVSENATNLGANSSKMGIQAGERYSLLDLLYGLMLPSGNDAAIAIAEGLCGSVEAFAEHMNAFAERIGMEHSHFVNPHGLHNKEHYTTATDLAILMAYALQNEMFCKIISTVSHQASSDSGRTLRLLQSNRLLRDRKAETYTPVSCLYPFALGGKTGETGQAGKCLVAAARRNETTYIAVLLNGPDAPKNSSLKVQDEYNAQRFLDAITLFEYAFRYDLVTVTVADLLDRCLPDSIALSVLDEQLESALLRIDWRETDRITMPRYEIRPLLDEVLPKELVQVSLSCDDLWVDKTVGQATLVLNDSVLFTAPIKVEDLTWKPTPSPTESPMTTPAFVNTPTPVPKRIFRLDSCQP